MRQTNQTRKKHTVNSTQTCAKPCILGIGKEKDKRTYQHSPVFNNVSTHIWIGASDLCKEGTFCWHATGKKVTFINWRWDNPDNENNVEHCVSLLSVPNGKWDWHANDQSCNRMHHFVCEDFRTLLGIVVPLKK
ncbi:galactose-specific C-type lectin [Culex quinquefasciatus]|uniref:Galactose-specific C-type lectin n=1 Tax=Culex quinquefasciatus TaxID=7176 RepID=B0W9P5_CULQU|nr:galactose-specific C-type lectin [Culex quinquefasciatus]|eukprot:XP_001845429.1 galactose-specific C-type lectin [Culex quinquefasciatus]